MHLAGSPIGTVVLGSLKLKLVGLISAIPATMHVCDTEKTVEINALCVHKKLRSKSLAPALIHAITRQVHYRAFPSCRHCQGGINKACWHLQVLAFGP